MEDIRRMKEGKQPLTEEELRDKRERERTEEAGKVKERMEQAKRKKEEGVRRLVENALEAQEKAGQRVEAEETRIKYEQMKHYVALGVFMVVWIGFIIYQNVQMMAEDM